MSAAYAFLLASLILERAFDPLIAIPALLAGLAGLRDALNGKAPSP